MSNSLASSDPPARPPECSRSTLHSQSGRRLFGIAGFGRMLLFALGWLMLLFAAAVFCFGSSGSALAWLQGNQLVIQPKIIDLGACRPGERKRTAFLITNRQGRTVTIVGGTTT